MVMVINNCLWSLVMVMVTILVSSSSLHNPEQDYLDTLSGEVFEAEIYSSQMLEREDVGHLYNIFTWAQRLLKVASFQEIVIIFPPPMTIILSS